MKGIFTFITIVTVFFLIACQGNESTRPKQEKTDSSYAIIGKVTGQDSGWIYLIHRQTESLIQQLWITDISNSTERQTRLKSAASA
jgi:hypothetical protein